MPEDAVVSDVDELHAEAARRLARVDSRYTAHRRKLVEMFSTSARPMSMPEIVAANRSLAQSSVYRNLVVLEAAGVVRRIVTGDDHSRFELSESVTGHHHHHLVCASCGSVTDFTLPPRIETSMERQFAAIAARHSFAPLTHQMDLIGRCSECR